MAAGSITIKLAGIDQLRESLSGEKVNSELARTLGKVVSFVNSELESQIIRDYRVKSNLNSVLLGRSNNNLTQGKNFLSTSLVYKQKSVPLSRYYESRFWGNLNQPKARKGWVHNVQITRGRTERSHGKENRGGFTPRNKSGVVKRYGAAGSLMFERMSDARTPLRILYGPSLADLVSYEINKTSSFSKIERAAVKFFMDDFFL